MKILLTNHHLRQQTGSEIYTYTLALALKDMGHDVSVYTKYPGRLAEKLYTHGVRYFSHIEEIAAIKFDVAHVHHLTCALEVRHQFPHLPIVYQSHGSRQPLEKPPLLDIHISQYLAISPLVKKALIVPKGNKIQIVENGFDINLFTSKNTIRKQPEKALIISNKMTIKTKAILQEALTRLHIESTYIGGEKQIENDELPEYINKADIVFSLGRGAVESLLCGRATFIFDVTSADGMVTENNYEDLRSCHFSGLLHRKKYTTAQIIREIKNNYSPTSSEALREKARKDFDINLIAQRLIGIYKKAVKDPPTPLPQSSLKIIKQILDLIKAENEYAAQELEQIKDSKLYTTWRSYSVLKKLASFK